MATETKKFQHVNYLWDDKVADQLDPVERLRYRSNLLGASRIPAAVTLLRKST